MHILTLQAVIIRLFWNEFEYKIYGRERIKTVNGIQKNTSCHTLSVIIKMLSKSYEKLIKKIHSDNQRNMRAEQLGTWGMYFHLFLYSWFFLFIQIFPQSHNTSQQWRIRSLSAASGELRTTFSNSQHHFQSKYNCPSKITLLTNIKNTF